MPRQKKGSATLRLATRKSPLALAQAELVAARLREKLGVTVELLPMTTTGDRQAQWSLEKQGGKGLFTTELEQAVIDGEADLAVHSTKDLPGHNSPQLIIAGYLPRADPRDVLVLRSGTPKFVNEGHGTPRLAHSSPTRPCTKSGTLTLATSSPRRRGQLALLFPEATFCEIRGNVETRLSKLASGSALPEGRDGPVCDRDVAPNKSACGTVLAAAGLARLGIATWPGLEFRPLALEEMVPAVGQGAIAVQTRIDDAARFAPILDADTARAVRVERAFQAALGGGCHTAFAAHAAGDTLHLFHEKIGLRRFPLSESEAHAPADTAKRILNTLGLLP